MEMKDNVYEENTQAEQEVVEKESAESRENGALDGSAVLGKFKDVDALAKAYAALQAEFTRRSQKLKLLQREKENLVSQEAQSISTATPVGAEKLRKNAAVRAQEGLKFDRFVSEIEASRETRPVEENVQTDEKSGVECTRKESSQGAESLECNQESKQNAAMQTLRTESAESVVISRENEKESMEELYARASENEQVRLRIIGEYLNSIGKGAPLMKGGVGIAPAPKARAKSLTEAGDMALRFFKGKLR